MRYIIIVATCLAFVACGKDKDGNSARTYNKVKVSEAGLKSVGCAFVKTSDLKKKEENKDDDKVAAAAKSDKEKDKNKDKEKTSKDEDKLALQCDEAKSSGSHKAQINAMNDYFSEVKKALKTENLDPNQMSKLIEKRDLVDGPARKARTQEYQKLVAMKEEELKRQTYEELMKQFESAEEDLKSKYECSLMAEVYQCLAESKLESDEDLEAFVAALEAFSKAGRELLVRSVDLMNAEEKSAIESELNAVETYVKALKEIAPAPSEKLESGESASEQDLGEEQIEESVDSADSKGEEDLAFPVSEDSSH